MGNAILIFGANMLPDQRTDPNGAFHKAADKMRELFALAAMVDQEEVAISIAERTQMMVAEGGFHGGACAEFRAG